MVMIKKSYSVIITQKPYRLIITASNGVAVKSAINW